VRQGLAAVLLAAFVTACSAGGGAGTGASPPPCPAAADAGVPLAIRLAARPAPEPPPVCSLVRYRAVLATAAWGAMPKQLRAAAPDVQVWQERSLLYSCERCDAAAFRLPWVREHHPEWILHTADGAEIHPDEHPGWVLLDFGDAGYQGAWSLRIQQSLTDGGWTGVDVADAGNEPGWSGTPVDPRTGTELQSDDRATYLAQALSLVHAAMRTQGFFLLAQNGPPTIVEPAQINSADALTTGTGFARLHGAAWTSLLRYYLQVQRERAATFVFETGPDPGERRDVYGLAGYLLVATPRGAYGLAPGTAVSSLYDLDLGAPDPDVLAQQVGEAWTRTYPDGAVAVNPSDLPTELSLGAAGTITLPPGGAAIAVGSRLVTSY
jgi:putative glycosyl hydrolase-like family 15 (GHL15) protein